MPHLSRIAIRLAFFHAWLGFGLATLIIAQKGQPNIFSAQIASWVLAHVNLLLVGWMVQLALGVAYWILPRLPNTRTERGRFGFAVSAFVCLNGGVWIYTGGILWAWGELQILGLALQILAILNYGIHVYPRIRPTIV